MRGRRDPETTMLAFVHLEERVPYDQLTGIDQPWGRALVRSASLAQIRTT